MHLCPSHHTLQTLELWAGCLAYVREDDLYVRTPLSNTSLYVLQGLVIKQISDTNLIT